MMGVKAVVERAMEQGRGILRLAPTWVPRNFCRPGRRLRLHPDDYYAMGLERGGIDERWFSSVVQASIGGDGAEDEGLSYIVAENGEKATLLEAVSEFKGALIGEGLWARYGCLPTFAKFFDNVGALPMHIHHREEHARMVGQNPKPEMYFYPAQYNNYPGEFAYTFFGINAGVTREQLRASLADYAKGDNKITDLSRAYRLTIDTGWDVPAGILHAPGSLCTYEPQYASDIGAMFQSVLHGEHRIAERQMWNNVPPDRVGDVDFLMDIIDFEANNDPDFYQKRHMTPQKIESGLSGGIEEWICYKSEESGAKRLTVLPGQSVTVRDGGAYGAIVIQGHGTFGAYSAEAEQCIRFGQMTQDEFFVSEGAALDGVKVTNHSTCENMVILKNFSRHGELEEIARASNR